MDGTFLLDLFTSVQRNVWFGNRDVDPESSGDIFFVNTNTLDLFLTFDPQSKEQKLLSEVSNASRP